MTRRAAWDTEPVRFRSGSVNHLIVTNVLPELYGPLRYSMSDVDRPGRRGGPDPDRPICGREATSRMTGPDDRLPLCRTCEAWMDVLDAILVDAREHAARCTTAYQQWQQEMWTEEQRLVDRIVAGLSF